ncbi:hypothetical protein N9M10_04530 [Hellea sp.]|nr:hypothetical protein [Hellea sp.]
MSWLGELSDFGPAPLAVDIYWDSYPGKKAHIWRLWQQTGWVQVVRMSLETPISSHEEIITLFCNDMGQPMPTWQGSRLFNMRSSIPSYMHHEPPEELEDQADALYWDFLGRCDRKNLTKLARGEDTLFKEITNTEDKALAGVTEIDQYIGSLRRERRHPNCTEIRKTEIDAKISDVAQYKPKLLASIPEEVNKLRKAYETFEDDVFESVTYHGQMESLYTVRWTMQSRKMPPLVNVSLWTEERFMGNLNVGTRWKEQLRAGHSADVTPDKPNEVRTKKDVRRALAKQTKEEPTPSSDAPKKRGRPKGSKNLSTMTAPKSLFQKSVGAQSALGTASLRKAKREQRQELNLVLQNHGTIAELKHVRAFIKGKTGSDLKLALIHLAKQDFMSVDDAVYLYKAISALNSNKTKRD